MDYSKIESALAAKLGCNPSDGSLSVFIAMKNPLAAEQVSKLRSFGIASNQGNRIVTASVSPDTIEKLSDLPWVEQISLAQKQRLM